ncbi:MAG: diaminopimelate epimerase [Nitrososphaerota archaeon]|jgi:diaminopimelate epimerase|nr:diaminopimelate epimerase [Nitrososphaerota archaeon]
MKFWKMHGLGNDYIVIDNREGQISNRDAPRWAKMLCERRFSVGADGLLLVCPSQTADIKMQMFNADGSEAEMCGNGIRCFGKYCYEEGIVKKTEFTIETLADIKYVWLILEANKVLFVKVNMGEPNWQRYSLPMLGEGTCIDQKLQVGEVSYQITGLSMGNPHCVTFVENVDSFPVGLVGALFETHKIFPKRANAVFVQVLNPCEIRVRVWERGCGETLACGTGACASFAVAKKLGRVQDKVTVHLRGGDLQIATGEDGIIYMLGPAENVYEGRLFKESLL